MDYEAMNAWAAVATALFTGALLVVGIRVAKHQRTLMEGGLEAVKVSADVFGTIFERRFC